MWPLEGVYYISNHCVCITASLVAVLRPSSVPWALHCRNAVRAPSLREYYLYCTSVRVMSPTGESMSQIKVPNSSPHPWIRSVRWVALRSCICLVKSLSSMNYCHVWRKHFSYYHYHYYCDWQLRTSTLVHRPCNETYALKLGGFDSCMYFTH